MRFQHLRELYHLQVNSHEHDSARFWAIFSLMSVINGGLIAIVVSTEPDPIVKYSLAVFGLLNCVAWYMMQRRFAFWVKCYKLRRSVVGKYYFRAILTGRKDADDIEIAPLDQRALATQYFTRHRLKGPGHVGKDSLPRYYCEPPPGEEKAPEKTSWFNEKYPGWGSMRMGQRMPVLFGLLWSLAILHQGLSDRLNATPPGPKARILHVEHEDDVITITLEVPSDKKD